MKFLKKFEFAEYPMYPPSNVDPMTIKDILLDFEDDGYNPYPRWVGETDSDWLDNKKFKLSISNIKNITDIKPYIDRLDSYLRSVGYKINKNYGYYDFLLNHAQWTNTISLDILWEYTPNKIVESVSINTVKDILLDANDIEIQTNVREILPDKHKPYSRKSTEDRKVQIEFRKDRSFLLSEIIDVVHRLDSYFKSEGLLRETPPGLSDLSDRIRRLTISYRYSSLAMMRSKSKKL